MRVIGEYVLSRSLGRGATAEVYLAHPKQLDPTVVGNPAVALKVFHPGFWDQPELRRRAHAEFLTVSSLKHPSIVRVLKPLWDADPPSVVMEYIEGASLEQFQGRLPYVLPEVAVLIIIEVLSALEHAHAEGVIHRDLKPANILIGNDGRVLVSDFGLAKITDASRVTLTGTILGSPDFMAPEQARGEATSPRSDLFAAAAILYFLVTGTKPFTRHSGLATLAAVIECDPEPAQRRNPKLSPELGQLIQKGLSKNPGDRFEDALAFRKSLENHLRGLGLAHPDFTFPIWITNSSETTFSAMKSVAHALIQRCERALLSSNWDGFLETLSTLSSLSPESAAIPRLMDEYQNKRRKKRRVFFWLPIASALFIAGVVSTFIAYRFRAVSHPDVIAQPVAVQPSVLEKLPVLLPPQVEKVTKVAPEAPKPEVPKPEVPKKAEIKIAKAKKIKIEERFSRSVQKSAVKFDIPEGVKIFWNNQPVDLTQPFEKQPAGTYQLRLVKTGMKPIEQTIVVKADEPTVIKVR